MKRPKHRPAAVKYSDDDVISNLVRSVRFRVPDELEHRVNQLIEISFPLARHKTCFRFRRVFAVAVLAAIIGWGAFTYLPTSYSGQVSPDAAHIATKPVEPIREIRTNFEIRKKNIKILWVQKQNFKLRRILP